MPNRRDCIATAACLAAGARSGAWAEGGAASISATLLAVIDRQGRLAKQDWFIEPRLRRPAGRP